MKRLHPIMFAGTGSDVGKSIVAAAFCRIFRQDGYQPAPFKAQNMALNSFVTPDGLEIGRAQAVQAEAAGIPCHTDMNPLLLKPQSDHTSQVVLHGKPIGNKDAYDYWRKGNHNSPLGTCDAFTKATGRLKEFSIFNYPKSSHPLTTSSTVHCICMALHHVSGSNSINRSSSPLLV
jgi:adenosylcobyric acid synthase